MENWTLMCPDKCPGLSDVYGKEFNELYEKYEREGLGSKTVKAQDLWFRILTSQIETGTPYLLYKDSCNKKSNQKNLGCIKSSNLCTEIIEYTNDKESAVCNLASINLNSLVVEKEIEGEIIIYSKSDCKFCRYSKNLLKSKNIDYEEIILDDDDQRKDFYNIMNEGNEGEEIKTVPQILINGQRIGGFSELYKYVNSYIDYNKLYDITRIITKNLNKIIDANYYPTHETKSSNKKHRPIGIGVQGLADLFCKLKIPFDSQEAKDINDKIFETILLFCFNGINGNF